MRFLDCPDCGSMMTLTSRGGKRFYRCINRPKCPGSHGADDDGRPLGMEAPQHVRSLRREAHRLAGIIWPWDRRISRAGMYCWIQRLFGLNSPEDAHIARMMEADLKKLIAALRVEIVACGLLRRPETCVCGSDGLVEHDGFCRAYMAAVASLDKLHARILKTLAS